MEIRERLPSDRYIHLVLENDHNVASHMRDGYFSAQWNDDAHHVLHVLLTGEGGGYYGDYIEEPAKKLARALSEGFIYQGEPSRNRNGEPRGTPSADLSPQCFVVFLQNHDQVGNRAFGERLTEMTEPRALEAAIALQNAVAVHPAPVHGRGIGEPHTLPVFLGNERGAGRNRSETAAKGSSTWMRTSCRIRTRQKHSRPRRRDLTHASGRAVSAITNGFLGCAGSGSHPGIPGARSLGADVTGEKAVEARWRLGDGSVLTMAVNLGDVAVVCGTTTDPLLFESCEGAFDAARQGTLPPHATVVTLTD